MHLSTEDKRDLLRIARDSIETVFTKRATRRKDQPGENLREPCGAFVTLHHRGELRGCVGYIEARFPLWRTIAEAAQKAAFEDPRFAPLAKDEFDEVEIEISVLSPLKRVTDVLEVEVGKHGLVIDAGYTRGLLLPQVATEYGWNREQFLSHTSRKAGLAADAWKKEEVSIFTFSSDIFSEAAMLTQAE